MSSEMSANLDLEVGVRLVEDCFPGESRIETFIAPSGSGHIPLKGILTDNEMMGLAQGRLGEICFTDHPGARVFECTAYYPFGSFAFLKGKGLARRIELIAAQILNDNGYNGYGIMQNQGFSSARGVQLESMGIDPNEIYPLMEFIGLVSQSIR